MPLKGWVGDGDGWVETESASQASTVMSIVFPGDHVQAQHVNLKLGPGLQQLSTVTADQTALTVIATRAGELRHSANGSKWWIESNSRRVREFRYCMSHFLAYFERIVYPCSS